MSDSGDVMLDAMMAQKAAYDEKLEKAGPGDFSYNYSPAADEPPPEKLTVNHNGFETTAFPIKFNVIKPVDQATGVTRDQTGDAAKNMRYAESLGLPRLLKSTYPRAGKAIIVGGAPSVKEHLETIRALAADPDNAVFSLNWTHTWLIQQGIIPHGTVFFEIDAEPDSILKNAHKSVTYYICSHCHSRSFDELKDYKRVLWHSPPNSEGEGEVFTELFAGDIMVGGGINSFTRTVSIALILGFRALELFGCDGSFPDDSLSTHVEGYETANDVKTDSLIVYAKDNETGEVRPFKTVGYLALQTEEFKEYCRLNHQFYACRVYGDGLLRYVHAKAYPDQYRKLGE
jgi:hypothetical protein